MALTDKLTAIADAIRGKTGKTDALTLDQMPLEIANIVTGGGSGGGGGSSGIYMAEITLAEYFDNLTITHNLGSTNILLVAAWVETLGDFVPEASITLAKYWSPTDIVTHRGGNGFCPAYTWNISYEYASPSSPNAASYERLTIQDENTVILPRAKSGSTGGYIAGLTYKVIVVAEV